MRDLTLKEIIKSEFEGLLNRLRPDVAEIANFVIEDKERPYITEEGKAWLPKNHSWGNTIDFKNGSYVSNLYISQVEKCIREYLKDNLTEFIKHEFLHQRGFNEEEVCEEEIKFNPFI